MQAPKVDPVLPQHLFDWLALVETLTPADRDGLIAHFVALEPEDRYRRFGHPIADDGIARHVEGIDFRSSSVYGVRDGDGHWLGIGHLGLETDPGRHGRDAELGLSVLGRVRGRGLGAAIFRCAVARAARQGAARLFMHCLATNRRILSIARAAGMTVECRAGEADAWLVVPDYTEFVDRIRPPAASRSASAHSLTSLGPR